MGKGESVIATHVFKVALGPSNKSGGTLAANGAGCAIAWVSRLESL